MGLWEDLMAEEELKRSGSIFGKPQQPEWRKGLGPLAGTALEMIDKILGIADPMSNIGGPQQTAQILPATWKAMAPEAKAMMNVFADKFPGAFGRVLASEPDITAQVTKAIPSQAAATLRKATPTSHMVKVRPDYATTPYSVGHELQHSLNVPRVAGTDPLDALTIGTLLKDLLPAGHRGSLNTMLGETISPVPLMQRMFGGGVNKALQIKPTANRNMMRAAMDEGLAYTAENAARPGADPLLKTLAARLGLEW